MSKETFKTAKLGSTIISSDGVDATQVNASKTETNNFVGGSTFLSGVPFGNHNDNPAEDLFIPSTVVSPLPKIPGYQRFVWIKNQLARLKGYYNKFTKIANLIQRFNSSASEYEDIKYNNRDAIYKKLIGGE